MTLKQIFLVVIFFFGTSCLTFSQSKVDFNLLPGKWKFVKFDWPNYVPDTAKIIMQSNKDFKDAIYYFTKDKRLLITQPNGPKGYSTNLTYSIKGDKVYIVPAGNLKAPPQIIQIDMLTNSLLKIYVEGFPPVGTFKRMD